MRSLWLTALAGATVLCVLDFGTVMTTPVSAADSAGADIMPICTLPKCLNPRVTTKSGIGTANATAEAKIHPDDAVKWCATYKPKDKLCVQEQVRSGWVGFKGLYRANADCVAGRMTPIDGNTYTYIGVWDEGPGKGRPKFTTTNRQFPHTKWDETGVTLHPDGTITGWGGGSPNLAAQWEVLCAGTSAPTVAPVNVPQPMTQTPAQQAQPPVQLRSDQLKQAADPQPSAEFGTPEATAKIASKAGFIDVVGVKLGMPLNDALGVLKAHNANLVMEPAAMAPYEALPGVVMTPILASKKNTNTAPSQEKEYVALLPTFAPNEAFVWGVLREVLYEKEENRPLIETVVAGLRQKYGQESVQEGVQIYWMYDAQGQQVPEAKAKGLLEKCGFRQSVGLGFSRSGLHAGYFSRQVVGGYYPSGHVKTPLDELCRLHSIVQAEVMSQAPTGKVSPPLVGNVRVTATNRQLESSGVTSSHVHLIREATKLAESRKGDAAKREIPKF